jgi:transglutaminase-like putative cysteine protease
MIGADASHAWASVFAPNVGWVDFDPTNRTFVDDSYIVAAIGRDYSDVPPLKGVIFTESKKNTMKVSVDMSPLVGDESAA